MAAQLPHDPQSGDSRNTLPDGRDRTQLILKAEHEASLRDVEKIRQLAEEVKISMEKDDRHVLSIATLRKLDEIEKLTKRVRGRLKRF
jgi:hypothetical protein